MALDLTREELRELAIMVAPLIKSTATDVGTAPLAESLEGISTLPAVYRGGAITKIVRVPLNKLQGANGDKGDALEFRIIGSYITLDTLIKEYPNGPLENGFFKVGEKIYIWTGNKYEPLNLDVFREFSLEQFSDVDITSGTINIDYLKTPYAKIVLSGNSTTFDLNINNTRDGSVGKILVIQTGFKQIALGPNIKGTIDLPLNTDTIALLSYNRLGNTIYMHSNTVLGDIQYPTPQMVKDFMLVYSDSTACQIQWTAPYANNIYDKATEYDIRYANDIVDANDVKTWNGLKKVEGAPIPETPGELQMMTISGLSPNKEYYIYLKAIKNNFGIQYISDASDFIYFKTLGSEDMTKAYRINLTKLNLFPQHEQSLKDTDGTVCSIDKMVDEPERNIYLSDGYPDTKNKDYTTYWKNYPYGRNASPYDAYIDLFSQYTIDKLFVYSRSKPKFSIYGMKDFGYNWEKIGEINIAFNSWSSLDFQSYKCRFIKISFDLNDFGAIGGMKEGEEAFPKDEYNTTIDRIDNIILYGRPSSSIPEGIRPPLRRSTGRKTVDQFFCVNGHAYQQGRIHSMCSGERVRLYISPGHFCSFEANGQLYPWERIADMRFNVDNIGWIKNNNGTGNKLVKHLTDTYKCYGLRPFLTFTSVFDYCLYDKSSGANRHNHPMDCYWLPGAWKALPTRGVGGTTKYFAVTYDANSYRTMAKLSYALAAKFGNNAIDGNKLFWPLDADTTTGLDLLSGIEIENEPDADWNNWRGYTRPEEFAAICSAAADGHGGILEDEDGNKPFGVHRADTQQLAISSGTAGINPGYYESAILHWKARRPKPDIPINIFSMHRYFSISGNQHSDNGEDSQYAVNAEYAIDKMTTNIREIIDLRNRYAPTTEIAITEFGYGEAGGRGTKSNNQCYTMPGRVIGDWIIPDRHRADVKGAWTVRASMYFMYLGIDMVNYYSTECEGNYFGKGKYDSGAGTEMWHWNDCKDLTPGAKDTAIRNYEHGETRGGFACMGLFGNILSNGAFPISRAYWWVATMRNRLKNYVYIGRKYLDIDEKIMVYCFKKEGEEKGAYVIYYNDSQNTGIANVEIPIPEGVAQVKHITTYVPEIANPERVPNTIGYDRNRTGLVAARHERYENGIWVIKSKGSYTVGKAAYPENPQEGDEVVVLPTTEENPYFPIVGPVQAKASANGNNITAQQYEKPAADGTGKLEVLYDVSLAWRQVEAVCDYIDYTEEGIHGSMGDETKEEVIRGMIKMNISEFPEYILFDAVPNPDYRSIVTDLASHTVSSSTIELWWNNTSTEDTSYQIFESKLPEAGYNLLKEVPAGIENKIIISGLVPNTTYYYKIRPIKNGKFGSLSDYVSAKTFSELPTPTNLNISQRTATGIMIAWEYGVAQLADFSHFAVYRADETDVYTLVATIENINVQEYADSGLMVGSLYKYKVRAIGLNGQSNYTNIVETRTLLPEECSPVLISTITDKLGIKITLEFDLALSAISGNGKNAFSLTEDGSTRLITAVNRDEANHKLIIISVPEGSLKNYDQRSDIRINYVSDGIITSQYGVILSSFSNVKVTNLIGNFTNMEAMYKLNCCAANSSLPESTEWNNLAGDPRMNISMQLVDTYGRISSIVASSIQVKPAFQWGGNSSSGYCEIEGIEQAVYSVGWNAAYGSTNNESILARLKLSGLKNENRYTIKAYGGAKYGDKKNARIKVGDKYSAEVTQLGNLNTFMTIEDCIPSDGELNIDLINMSEKVTTSYPSLLFMIIEEYKSNDAPENTDVFIRGITVMEDEGNAVVKTADIHFNLNLLGFATAYRISESEDLSNINWVDIVNDNLSVPFTITSGFGEKIYYIQVKNLYSESNVKTVNLEYKDPYVALELNNIFINNDDADTYSQSVLIFISKSGIPTHYKISENPDFVGVGWTAWTSDMDNGIPFTLSEGYGQKTVYCQLKDTLLETAIKVDTIEYKESTPVTPLSLISITINSGSSTTTEAIVSVEVNYIGDTAPTHYRMSESENLNSVDWIAFASPVNFNLSDGYGQKTIYCQIKNNLTVSEVKYSVIERKGQSIEPGNKKLIASIGWPKEVELYDSFYGINRPRIGVNRGTPQVIKWNDGTEAGSFTNIDSSNAGVGQNKQGAITGNDSGIYSDDYLKYNTFAMKYAGVSAINFKLIIPSGNYKIRLFCSTISTNNKPMPQAHYYLITDGYGTDDEIKQEIGQPADYTYFNNTSQWIEADLSVPATGEFYLRVETIAIGATVVAPLNIIEIIPQ